MKAKRTFQPMRILMLIRNTLVLNRSSIVLITAAVGSILMLISLLDSLGECRPDLQPVLPPLPPRGRSRTA